MLGACGEDDFAIQIADEIEAATGGSVSTFRLRDMRSGQRNQVWLEPPEGSNVVPAEDMVAAILVIHRHRGDQRLGDTSLWFEISPGTGSDERLPPVSVSWRPAADGADWEIDRIDGSLTYGDWMCELPTLHQLLAAGAGSDFREIGECSPNLDTLAIENWNESTGYEGLTRLKNLRWLDVWGGVKPGDFPELKGLHSLTIQLEEDTIANQAAIAAKAIGCDVTFCDSAGRCPSYPDK
jgi:hypothetical protein